MNLSSSISPSSNDTAQMLRRVVLLIIAFGVAGTLVELLLLGHYKELSQWPPLILLGLTAIGVGVMLRQATPRTLRLFRWLMLLMLVSSLAGVVFHLKGNVEFRLETNPDLSGFPLFWKSIKTGTPVLAPGVMAQLGLLGLAFTFRHPELQSQIDVASR